MRFYARFAHTEWYKSIFWWLATIWYFSQIDDGLVNNICKLLTKNIAQQLVALEIHLTNNAFLWNLFE